MVFINRTFDNSKLPQRVETYVDGIILKHQDNNCKISQLQLNIPIALSLSLLTPCWQRSNDISLIKVVFPLPVGPVNIVNSPDLNPFNIAVSLANLFHYKYIYANMPPCTPNHIFTYFNSSYFLCIQEFLINIVLKLKV